MQQKNDKKKTKKKEKPRFDYETLECAYVIAEDMKIKDFCKKHKITEAQLYNLRKKFGWDEKRKKYRQSIADAVMEKAKEQEVLSLVEAKRMRDETILIEAKRIYEISQQEDQFYMHETSAKERLEGGFRPVIKLDLMDTKRYVEFIRACDINSNLLDKLLMLNEDKAMENKVQINFINGKEEYSE